jgi:hypothetical protein
VKPGDLVASVGELRGKLVNLNINGDVQNEGQRAMPRKEVP